MSKKNEKKDGEKSKQKKSVPAAPAERSEASFYLLQTRALEEQVERYQRKCDELEVQKADFSSRYSLLEQEKRDMVQYLKRCMAQLEEDLAAASERLGSEQLAREEQTRLLDLQLSQLRQDHQERSDQLSAENMTLAGKLASLEEFGEQRERLMSDLSLLEEQLANQKETHNEVIYQLEKNAVLEKERLKRENADNMGKAAVELQLQARRGVSEAVSRCLGEREALQGELAHLAEQNQVLVQENQALKDTENLLRRKDQVLDPLIRHLSHSKQSNLRVVQQLTDRCKQLGVELKEQDSICQGLQQIQSEHTLLLAEAQALRQEHERVLEQGRKDAMTAKRLGEELEDERRRRGQTETILQEAAVALGRALMVERNEEEEQQEVEEQELQVVVCRNQIMLKLLAILNRAAWLGVDCGMTHLLSKETPPRSSPPQNPLLARGPRSGTTAETDLQGVQGGLPFQDHQPAPQEVKSEEK
ncbi:unnamed protein product [Merluccius merluccius]